MTFMERRIIKTQLVRWLFNKLESSLIRELLNWIRSSVIELENFSIELESSVIEQESSPNE